MDGRTQLKVLFLTDSLSDLDGVGRYSVRLLAAMQAARPGLKVHVLLARKHRPTSAEVPGDWTVEVALPPDYYYYMSPARFWVSRMMSTWSTWRAARGADVVHAIKDFPHSQIGLDAARLAGKPCVATAHGTYTIQPLLDARHKRRARRVYSKLDHIVSVSRYTRKRLLGLVPREVLDPEQVTVIPNCVNVEHYLDVREIGERPWHGKRFSLGIGEVKERKGHHLSLAGFLQVAERYPDWHHFIVGRLSQDEYEGRLRAMAAAAGCAERVHFLGNIQEDEKIDLLQRAEVFVHTPVTAADGGFEGFGIVYLEAAAAGTCSLGSLDCGAEDAIVDGSTGILVAQNVPAVAEAMDRLLGDAELRARMGAAGREHARATRWEDNATQVLAIYDRLLEAGS